MKEPGLSSSVEITYGDVLNEAKSKSQYHLYLDVFNNKLLKGSIILAHNTILNPRDTYKYLKKVYSDKYTSLMIASDPVGITLTIKK